MAAACAEPAAAGLPSACCEAVTGRVGNVLEESSPLIAVPPTLNKHCVLIEH